MQARGDPVNLPVFAQRVLGFLAITGKWQTREMVAGQLWSFASQDRAHANLRTALWQLRRAHPDVVQATRNGIGLKDDVVVDYSRITDQARRLLRGSVDPEELMNVPLDLFEAELLPGWDEDWLVIDRERHRQLRMHACEELSRRLLEIGCFALAVEAAYAAITIEPLCESTHRALAKAFLAEGNATRARQQFQLYRRLLADETGYAPSEEFVALVTTATPMPRQPIQQF